MNIEIVALESDGCENYRRDFDTVKEAKAFVKEALLTPEYWNRRAESPDGHKWVATIQLLKDGEITQDWFPKWTPILK